MPDGNSPSLDILIKLRADIEEALKAKGALEGVKDTTKDLSTSLPEGSELWAKYKNVLDDSGGAAEKFSLHGREMHHVIGELNRAVPGLGFALQGLLTSAGPMIIALLAIQAAMEYWNLSQEESAAAAANLARALDNIRASTHAALEEQARYNEAMKDAAQDSDAYKTELESQNAILHAQFEQKRKLLEQDKDAELANAKTPAERRAIETRYGAASGSMSSEEEQAKIDLMKSIVGQLRADIAGRSQQISGIDESYADAQTRDQFLKSIGQGPEGKGRQDIAGEVEELTKQRKALDDANIAAQKRITELTEKANSETDVHFINDQTRTLAENRAISGALGNFDAAQQGEKLSQAQLAANQAFEETFSKLHGGFEAMVAINKYHHDHLTSLVDETIAMKNALATLSAKVERATNHANLH